jgi:hypothetical protein
MCYEIETCKQAKISRCNQPVTRSRRQLQIVSLSAHHSKKRAWLSETACTRLIGRAVAALMRNKRQGGRIVFNRRHARPRLASGTVASQAKGDALACCPLAATRGREGRTCSHASSSPSLSTSSPTIHSIAVTLNCVPRGIVDPRERAPSHSFVSSIVLHLEYRASSLLPPSTIARCLHCRPPRELDILRHQHLQPTGSSNPTRSKYPFPGPYIALPAFIVHVDL